MLVYLLYDFFFYVFLVAQRKCDNNSWIFVGTKQKWEKIIFRAMQYRKLLFVCLFQVFEELRRSRGEARLENLQRHHWWWASPRLPRHVFITEAVILYLEESCFASRFQICMHFCSIKWLVKSRPVCLHGVDVSIEKGLFPRWRSFGFWSVKKRHTFIKGECRIKK